MNDLNVCVILPAAGSGLRFARGAPDQALSKVELDIAGKPVFLHAAELFIRRPDVGQVILAVAPDKLDDFRFRWGDKLGFLGIHIVAGGQTERWQTVANALEAVHDAATHVAVHDAARPLITDALIGRVFDAALRFAAVVPGCGVDSTLKRVRTDPADQPDADPIDDILGNTTQQQTPIRRVESTVDRKHLVAVQTPQVFEISLLRRAYQQVADGKLDPANVTDDAQLIEALGEPVRVVEGDSTNIKITYPADAELAQALLDRRAVTQSADLAKKTPLRR